ncbi:ATP-dependent dethiobiotin synthetase BioD 1 [bacterium HR30]|nr:ATP-dependent dethiobiotin synthetase BioD 1 [bacterium HR30]
MKGKIIFVTGTDTGVGKTTVSGLLAAGLAAQGLRVAVFKPVETGCMPGEDGKLIPADAVRLKTLARSSQAIEDVCPYAFAEPLAPAVAAERSGRSIDFRELCQHIGRSMTGYDVALVEGAGGWLVPLTPHLTFADLAVALRGTVVVVVANRLGALNHALLTAQNIRMHGARWGGYIWNHPTPPGDVAQTTNIDALRPWLGDALSTVPHLPSEALSDPSSAARLARDLLDLERLLRTAQDDAA